MIKNHDQEIIVVQEFNLYYLFKCFFSTNSDTNSDVLIMLVRFIKIGQGLLREFEDNSYLS